MGEKLVREIYGGVYHATPVLTDGGGNGINVYRVEVFGTLDALFLNEKLLVEIVRVAGAEVVYVPHDLKHIEALI